MVLCIALCLAFGGAALLIKLNNLVNKGKF